MRLVLDGRLSGLWTAFPGIIQSVNLTKMTCSVQPAIQGTVEDEAGAKRLVNLPLLINVPICFPNSNGFIVTFPIVANDEVLVVVASRCIDAWWQLGGVQRPMEARMHDLSDGFAIPGPRSQARLITGISATDLEIRNAAGNTLVSITGSGKIGCENATTSLKAILTDIKTAVSNWGAAMAALSGGAAPVTQAMVQVPGAQLVTDMTAITTKIGALLK